MTIKIEIEKKDRITLRSPYSRETLARIKSIPGHSWSKVERAWSYPLSIQICQLLRKEFGNELEIGPALWKWAAEKNKVDTTLKDLSSAFDAELKLVPKIAPKMHDAMEARTYQRSGARFLADRRQALDIDDLGLGKTVTSLAAIMETGSWERGDHLVISPSTSLVPTWANQIRRWTNATPYVAEGSADRRHKIIQEFFDAEGPKILLINPEMVRAIVEQWCNKCKLFEKELDREQDMYWEHHDQAHKCVWKLHSCNYMEILDHEWDSIIADECKYLIPVRPHSMKRLPQQVEGLVRLKSKPNGLRVPMTGTPFRGREWKIFGLLCWARPQDFKSFWQWIDIYFNTDKSFGVEIKGLREDRKDLFYHDLNINCLRRTRQEVRSDLPVNNIIDIRVQMTPAQKKVYQKWIAEGSFSGEHELVEGIGTLSELTRARQFAWGLWDGGGKNGKLRPLMKDSPKGNWLMGALEERDMIERPTTDGSADKIIIASQFTEILNMLRDHLAVLGVPTLMITGSKKKTEDGRLSADVFSAPEGPRILLLNTDAGGVSLTLDEYCDEMIILDEKFVDDDQQQLMGRIDNRGERLAPRNFYFIRTEETIETGIADSNMSQQKMQRALLDGRRGVEFLINLLKGKS